MCVQPVGFPAVHGIALIGGEHRLNGQPKARRDRYKFSGIAHPPIAQQLPAQVYIIRV